MDGKFLMKKSTNILRLIYFVSCAAGLMLSNTAFAGCSGAYTDAPLTISSPNATVSGVRDTTYPKLLNWSAASNVAIHFGSCNLYGWFSPLVTFSGMYIYTYYPGGPWTNYFIYPTGVQNIGFIISGSDTSYQWMAINGDTLLWPGANGISWNSDRVVIGFVQTGPLNPGTYVVPSKTFLNHYGSSSKTANDSTFGPGIISYSSMTVTANTDTCTIDANSIAQTINMPGISTSAISAPGTTGGNTPFSLSVSGCSTGIKLFATLTDVNDTSSTGNTLTNTGNAAGVGVQILKSGTPVSFGPQSSAIGNTNQFSIGTGQTSYSIPLVAQYVNTGTVKAGSVQSQAWVTFSYQ